MRFSTKTRYGIRAMIEIARADQSKGIFQKDISKNQDISNKYLDQIILALKVKGLIVNVKGKKSGYILALQPSAIKLLDIHNAFEPGICVIDCISKTYNCNRENSCNAKGFWMGLNNLITNYFDSHTLSDLVNGEKIVEQLLND